MSTFAVDIKEHIPNVIPAALEGFPSLKLPFDVTLTNVQNPQPCFDLSIDADLPRRLHHGFGWVRVRVRGQTDQNSKAGKSEAAM